MALVKIPAIHFVKAAKQDYCDSDTAIVRETIQNAVDAGATTITLESGENWFKITDNGCGMNEQVLVDAMLTLSGSHKSSDSSIGGFGAAKLLILFAHEKYEINTNDLHVEGAILEYTLTKKDYVPGTSITMWFHPEYGFNKNIFDYKAIEWLKTCDINAHITYNGEEYSKNVCSRLVKELDWCNIYCEDIDHLTNKIHIRIHGVTMFYSHVGDISKNIVLEITKPSINILTSSRDGFQWSYHDVVYKIIEEITFNKESFGKLFNSLHRYVGNKAAFISNIINPVHEFLKNQSNAENVVSDIQRIEDNINNGNIGREEAIEKIKNIIESVQGSQKVIKIIDEMSHSFINDIDFYIQINDTGYNSIPNGLEPNAKMKKQYAKIAKLWKACINHVLTSNGINNVNYCIGWIIDKKTEAAYICNEGVQKILINPYKFNPKKFSNKKHMVYAMLMTAIHEIAHMYNSYHNEAFVSTCHDMGIKSIANLHSYRELLEISKFERI